MPEGTGAQGPALHPSKANAEWSGVGAHIPFSKGGQHADETVEDSDEEVFQFLTRQGYKFIEDWDAYRDQFDADQEDNVPTYAEPQASIAERAELLQDTTAKDGWLRYLAETLSLSAAELPLEDVAVVANWLTFGTSCPREAKDKFFVRYPFGLTWAQRFGAHILHAHRKGKAPLCKEVFREEHIEELQAQQRLSEDEELSIRALLGSPVPPEPQGYNPAGCSWAASCASVYLE